VHIGLQGHGRLGLRAVDISVSRSIDHKRGPVLGQRGRDGSRITDVGLRMAARSERNLSPGCHPRKLPAAPCPENKDHAITPRRSPR
jgi:hypothetical protein